MGALQGPKPFMLWVSVPHLLQYGRALEMEGFRASELREVFIPNTLSCNWQRNDDRGLSD